METITAAAASATRIVIASDHAGFQQKQQIADWLRSEGYQLDDLGCDSEDSVDYPVFAAKAAQAVSSGRAGFGILVCGTGIGMAIAANKFPGIRAANVTDPELAALSRQHNDANVLALSGRFVSLQDNIQAVKGFLETPFAGGRHSARLQQIDHLQRMPETQPSTEENSKPT
jgi:ribose 5-phosphate isomerase B